MDGGEGAWEECGSGRGETVEAWKARASEACVQVSAFEPHLYLLNGPQNAASLPTALFNGKSFPVFLTVN